MSTLTLAQARTIVADHLDDNDASNPNERWSTTQIDTALQYALSKCLDDYLANGGERFDVLASKTSTTSGVCDLTTEDPLVVKGLSVQFGNSYYPIKANKTEDRGLADSTSRTVQVRYVPRMAIPTTTSHPLVGSGATAYNSWYAFDHWVCVQAAIFCAVKDAELRAELQSLNSELMGTVLTHAHVPRAMPFPVSRGWHSDHIKWVKDTWTASTKQLVLVLS
ncbi:MAG: hypothetical protein IPP74_14965 [Alphaproteobacteria bacterium]|nr:hypothetical protein [Alphaproteobacteria bacterium]